MQIPDDDSGYILYKRHPVYNHLFCGTNGEIYSTKRCVFLSHNIHKKTGRSNVSISGKTITRHRLIMQTFVGNSDLHIDHINEIKSDNRLCNLEYVTWHENMARRVRNGNIKYNKGESNANSKITEEVARHIINLRKDGLSLKEIINSTGLSSSLIQRIIYNKLWKHLPR